MASRTVFEGQAGLQEWSQMPREAALAESRGRVSGASGAAAKLQVPPSTLESRIKTLKTTNASSDSGRSTSLKILNRRIHDIHEYRDIHVNRGRPYLAYPNLFNDLRMA
jgi:hypothetical protein